MRLTTRPKRRPRNGKYFAVPTTVDGIRFDSKGESERYKDLKYLERAGLIRDLKLQVPYELAPSVVINGRKKPSLRYVADFVYFDVKKDCEVVDDFKGFETPEYKIKRHLMKHIFDIDIFESKPR